MLWKERIKEIIDERGMTQTELAKRVGVTRATMSLWLKDDMDFTEKNINKIKRQVAKALGVEVSYIDTGEVDVDSPDSGRVVPFIDDDNIRQWLNNPKKSRKNRLIYCPVNCGKRTFALTVNNHFNEVNIPVRNAIPAGSVIYLDPDANPFLGSTCAFINRDELVYIGQYVIYGEAELLAIPGMLSSFSLDNLDYCGRVIGRFFDMTPAGIAHYP